MIDSGGGEIRLARFYQLVIGESGGGGWIISNVWRKLEDLKVHES